MTVGRVTEISASSEKSFDDAVKVGIERVSKTLRNVQSAWVKDHNVQIENGTIRGYRVNMEVTFLLDE